MRVLMRAMKEEQQDKRSWRGNYLIGTFIILSLVLNVSLRQQSKLATDVIRSTRGAETNNKTNESWSADQTVIFFTASVSLVQIVSTFTLLSGSPTLSGKDGNHQQPDKEAISIIALAHALSTFLRDFLTQQSVATGNQGATHDAAFFSPVLALVAILVVTSLPSRPIAWFSLVMVGCGCSALTTKAGLLTTRAATADASRASLISCLAIFTGLLRNIALRQLVHGESLELRVRTLPPPYPRVNLASASILLSLVIVAFTSIFGPQGWGLILLVTMVTCVLSTAHFLISSHILQVFGVTSAALFSVWASLFEALVVTPAHLRPGLTVSALSLALLVVGHLLYLKHAQEPEATVVTSGTENLGSTSIHYTKPAPIQEQYTRLEFLLFFCAVIGVIFYVFQPSVSQRDLDTLSKVGLDGVFRRLLSVSANGDA